MKRAILLILLLPILASAQYFDVFDIDTTEYPIMKAKFYSIDANGNQILNHTPADFEITENGEPRDVISVSCPPQKDEPFSVVIAVDVSGSMRGDKIQNAKESIKSFIDMIPNNGSEVAIIAFNDENYFVSDFTSNKSKLKSKVDNLKSDGGTDFNAALLYNLAGALLTIKNAKHTNKSIILVTDGEANGSENQIINNANNLSTKIYSIILNHRVPIILQNISNATEGKIYKDVINQTEFEQAFLFISNEIINGPCEIIWESDLNCNIDQIAAIMELSNFENRFYYPYPKNSTVRLETRPNYIKFEERVPGYDYDTTITITAFNKDITIESILPKFGSIESFSLINTNFPLFIAKGTSKEFTLRYSPKDSSIAYLAFQIETDKCNASFSASGGFNSATNKNNTLRLTQPNGGEIFIAGTDSLITWEGVVPSDTVSLDYSTNNGVSWQNITKTGTKLNYIWRNIPLPASTECLLRVRQGDNIDETGEFTNFAPSETWIKKYGGANTDYAILLEKCSDGNIIIVGETHSIDGDITEYKMGYNIWVIKINSSNGSIIWQKIYGGSSDEFPHQIEFDMEGNLLIAATSYSPDGDVGDGSRGGKMWLLKINSRNGSIIWSKTYFVDTPSFPNAILKSKDESYVIVGKIYLKDNQDAFAIRINSSDGSIVWQKTYGGTNSDEAKFVNETSEGNYIINCITNSNDGDVSGFKGEADVWIFKINSDDGSIIWQKTYGGTELDYSNAFIECSDGNYITSGSTDSNDGDIEINKGDGDVWVLKLDHTDGSIIWQKTYGGTGHERTMSMIESKDENLILCCFTQSNDGDILENNGQNQRDIWILKLSKLDGTIIWQKTYGESENDIAYSIYEITNGSLLIDSWIENNQDLHFRLINISQFDGTKNWEKDYPSISNKNNTSFKEISEGKYILTQDIWSDISVSDILVLKLEEIETLQSDTSDAVFSIIMPEPMIQNNDIDMGQMIVGSTKDTIVSSVICNIGDAPLHVLGVDITGGDEGDFHIPRGAGDFYLNKGECQDMMFEFTPSALGNRTAVATIRTTIGDFKDTILIRGFGINPIIEATAEVVDFGVFELGNGKDTTVVLVKNVGSMDITITDTRLSGPDMEQFTLKTSPVNYTIAAGEKKEFQLNYTAKYGGKTNSFLDFHYDGIGSPIRSLLFAEGIGGEVYPVVADAYVGETVDLGIFFGKIKPEGLSEIATNFSATVSYNSTLLAPIDKSMLVTTEDNKSFITIAGELSGVPQIAAIPMKVGLGTADRSGLVITEFQLYNANGDSVDYDIEPGVGEFNMLGICEEGGKRLINPNGEEVAMQVISDINSGNTRIQLTLIETGQTELEIYDQIGNRIESIYSGTPSAGSQEINQDLSKYANGRYYIKLTTPTITKTEIIEVVR